MGSIREIGRLLYFMVIAFFRYMRIMQVFTISAIVVESAVGESIISELPIKSFRFATLTDESIVDFADLGDVSGNGKCA